MAEDKLYQSGYEAGPLAMFDEMKSQASDDDGKISELERYKEAAERVDEIQARAIRDLRSALCALKLSRIEHVWLCQDCGKRRNENGE